MTFFEAVLLGLVQGLTEFLPVSSSGHLVLLQNYLGIKEGVLTFDVYVHLGTLFSILVIFKKDIISLITNLPASLREIFLIVLAIIPAGLAGVILRDFFAGMYASGKIVGWMLLITGLILYYAENRTRSSEGKKEPSWLDALLIGIAQSFAILPGISRSGSTLSMGLLTGLKRREAARFSFLISIPTIGGAALLEALDAFQDPVKVDWTIIAAGTLVAFIAGVFAIKVLLKFLEEGKLKAFAIYCWTVGALTIIGSLIV